MSKKHAKYSASGSKRWLNCSGSVALIETCPPSVESSFALEGTKAHTLFEIFLRNRKFGLDAVEKTLLKDTRFSSDPEMVTHSKDAAKIVIDLCGEGAQLFIEEKVDLSFVEPDTFGTGDAAILFKDHLTVLDFKYGSGIAVEIIEYDGSINSQLAFYALGLLSRFAHHAIKKITIGVIQPRAHHEDGPLRLLDCDPKDILAFIDLFGNAIAESKKPDAPLKSGAWCQFCPATSICPEISKRSLEKAQIAFKEDYSEMSFPAIDQMTPETMGKALSVFPQLEFWIKEVKKRATENLNLGEKVPGFKLVQKRGRRQWLDPESVISKLEVEGLNSLIEVKPKSPAQVEKASKELKSFVEEHAIMVSSGVTIAPDKDKRDAVKNIMLSFDEWSEDND